MRILKYDVSILTVSITFWSLRKVECEYLGYNLV
jgi:hypothetical protein